MDLKSSRHELLNSTQEDEPVDKPAAGGRSSGVRTEYHMVSSLLIGLSYAHHQLLLITHCKSFLLFWMVLSYRVTAVSQ